MKHAKPAKHAKHAHHTKPATKHKPIKHYAASVIVLTNTLPTKVLLHHHKKFDKWIQPGGHQDEHENSIEAAIREVQEETGLDITPFLGVVNPIDDLAGFIPRPNYLLEEKIAAHGKEPEHYHLDQIYVVRIPEQPPAVSKSESHDIRWFTVEELPALPMLENTRMLIKQELAQP
jgi:8-oxo-dGTP pyrophosphatase MutT (NUDIX family)